MNRTQIEDLLLHRTRHIHVGFEKEGDKWKGTFLVT